MRYTRTANVLLTSCVALAVLGGVVSKASARGASKTIKTFIVYQAPAPPLVPGDEVKLARYDMFSFNRRRYYELKPNTYEAVRKINPDIIIFNYQQGPDTWLDQDELDVLYVNNIVRYNDARGHSMGNLNTDNPDLFLLTASGRRIRTYYDENRRLLDFGSAKFQAYWLEATIHDIVDQAWRPDGVFIDNCQPTWGGGYWCARPAKYPTDDKWTPAMIRFHTALAAGLHARGMKVWTNTDHVDDPAGYKAWLAIDADPNHPDFLASEGTYCRGWGRYACTFYDEARWKRQVDIMGDLVNCGATMFSHVKMREGGSGRDNYGRPVTYWDALWYAMGSFLLGQNQRRGNDYFYFSNTFDRYYKLYWYDEYERIDLGPAVGKYVKTVCGGTNIYWRRYEKGYVYVNPTTKDCASIILPEPCKRLSHATINDDPATFPDVTQIRLDSHRAAILLKSASLARSAARR